jgi:magnesium chelatase accessory protein
MASDHDRPVWKVDGRDWPNREHSRFIEAGGVFWHVQRMGRGPKLLLLHGTGSATHSFRDLLPRLAGHFEVLAPDLPGHGFTSMPGHGGLSLRGMSRLIGALTRAADFEPRIVVGHSAGAAILIEMTLSGTILPKAIVGINGALLPIRGASLFSPLAKLLFLNPLAPRLFAWRALGRDATRRLLESTGSHIEPRGIELYERLFRKPGHVAGTLGMMASWDLAGLQRRIGELSVPLVLVSGANDKSVPPGDAALVAARNRMARVVALPAGGHLLHEEDASGIADIILEVEKGEAADEAEADHLSKCIV